MSRPIRLRSGTFLPNGSVEVKFRLRLAQILDVIEKNQASLIAKSLKAANGSMKQILVCNVWLYHEWSDRRLAWEPAGYANVSTLYVPAQMLWLPDIVRECLPL